VPPLPGPGTVTSLAAAPAELGSVQPLPSKNGLVKAQTRRTLHDSSAQSQHPLAESARRLGSSRERAGVSQCPASAAQVRYSARTSTTAEYSSLCVCFVPVQMPPYC
jgi:hypothetical protein